MDLAEYFNQDENYFSESSGQLLPLSDMPFQHLLYSFWKLRGEFGKDFGGTHLYRAMERRLYLLPVGIKHFLDTQRKVATCFHSYRDRENKKSVARRWALLNNCKVNFEVKTVGKGYKFLEIVVLEEVNIRVKSHSS